MSDLVTRLVEAPTLYGVLLDTIRQFFPAMSEKLAEKLARDAHAAVDAALQDIGNVLMAEMLKRGMLEAFRDADDTDEVEF